MRDKRVMIWVILGLGFILLMNLPPAGSNKVKSVTRETLSPLHALFSGISHRINNTFRSIRGWGGLVEESQRQAAEIVFLKSQVHELKTLEKENIELRQKLRFVQRSERTLIPAEVIARDISGWWQTIRLNKGAVHGVSINQAVVTEEGLVGRVTDVSLRTCDVLLISDPNCRVSCRLPRNSGFGVLSGKGFSWSGDVLCRLDIINKNIDVHRNDSVVTSGLGGIFPKGIQVGYVDEITLDNTGLFQKADVLPAENLSVLSYVFILGESDPMEKILNQRRIPREVSR